MSVYYSWFDCNSVSLWYLLNAQRLKRSLLYPPGGVDSVSREGVTR